MSGERVLVVDDSKEIVRYLTEEVLPRFGYRVLAASDGRAGLQMIREHTPDLVLLDLNLPGMNGLEVMKALVEERVETSVVLMTAYGSEKRAIQAFRLGAKDYLVKPFTVDELSEVIERALTEPRLRQDNQQLSARLRHFSSTTNHQLIGLRERLQEAEEALATRSAELAELQKSKESFLATVSHDLRAPLNSILGFAQALEDVGSLNEEQALFANRIIHSTERMLDLVNALLDLARVTAQLKTVRQLCDLEEIARTALVDLQGQALSREVQLQLSPGDGLRPVSGDPVQLRQAISNLIDNAIKYSPVGATVEIALLANGSYAQVCVKDSGPGIAAEDLPHIFEEFYRSSRDSDNGLGLGLTLVQSIVTAHGGTVEVETAPGAGTTFRLMLPFE